MRSPVSALPHWSTMKASARAMPVLQATGRRAALAPVSSPRSRAARASSDAVSSRPKSRRRRRTSSTMNAPSSIRTTASASSARTSTGPRRASAMSKMTFSISFIACWGSSRRIGRRSRNAPRMTSRDGQRDARPPASSRCPVVLLLFGLGVRGACPALARPARRRDVGADEDALTSSPVLLRVRRRSVRIEVRAAARGRDGGGSTKAAAARASRVRRGRRGRTAARSCRGR